MLGISLHFKIIIKLMGAKSISVICSLPGRKPSMLPSGLVNSLDLADKSSNLFQQKRPDTQSGFLNTPQTTFPLRRTEKTLSRESGTCTACPGRRLSRTAHAAHP